MATRGILSWFSVSFRAHVEIAHRCVSAYIYGDNYFIHLFLQYAPKYDKPYWQMELHGSVSSRSSAINVHIELGWSAQLWFSHPTPVNSSTAAIWRRRDIVTQYLLTTCQHVSSYFCPSVWHLFGFIRSVAHCKQLIFISWPDLFHILPVFKFKLSNFHSHDILRAYKSPWCVCMVQITRFRVNSLT